MLLSVQPFEQLRETFPMFPLVLIGIGILALLWLLRRSRKKKKTKPASITALENRNTSAIREIGSIKLNQWMDKHYNSLKIPRGEFPTSTENAELLQQITKYQARSLSQQARKRQSRG